jgi:hypothetical protein
MSTPFITVTFSQVKIDRGQTKICKFKMTVTMSESKIDQG